MGLGLGLGLGLRFRVRVGVDAVLHLASHYKLTKLEVVTREVL